MKMISRSFWCFLLPVAFASCQHTSKHSPEKSLQEIMSDSKINNAAIIRNPVSANEPQDTVNIAKISFEETVFDFGEVDEGEIVNHVYRFTNTGKVPLAISSARSTCGCTVPEWPRSAIPPGGKGEITVRFNTQNKNDRQSKPITVVANTYPSATKVFLNGFVRPAREMTGEK